MYCYKCGQKTDDEAKFCESCGMNIQREQPNESLQTNVNKNPNNQVAYYSPQQPWMPVYIQTQPQRSVAKIVWGIIMILLGLSGAVFCLAFDSPSGRENKITWALTAFVSFALIAIGTYMLRARERYEENNNDSDGW